MAPKKRRYGDVMRARHGAPQGGGTDNHPAGRAAKAEIRRAVLAEIGPERAQVFDAFAGAGEMFRAVWRDAAGYAGCDTRWFEDDRLAFVADNRRVLRAIDLRPFTVFDLDAYGSPWEQVVIIAARRPLRAGERLGFAITEGSGTDMRLRGIPSALALLAGVDPHAAGASRSHAELIERAIAGVARRMRGRVARRWHAAGASAARVQYAGLVLEAERSR